MNGCRCASLGGGLEAKAAARRRRCSLARARRGACAEAHAPRCSSRRRAASIARARRRRPTTLLLRPAPPPAQAGVGNRRASYGDARRTSRWQRRRLKWRDAVDARGAPSRAWTRGAGGGRVDRAARAERRGAAHRGDRREQGCGPADARTRRPAKVARRRRAGTNCRRGVGASRRRRPISSRFAALTARARAPRHADEAPWRVPVGVVARDGRRSARGAVAAAPRNERVVDAAAGAAVASAAPPRDARRFEVARVTAQGLEATRKLEHPRGMSSATAEHPAARRRQATAARSERRCVSQRGAAVVLEGARATFSPEPLPPNMATARRGVFDAVR